MRAEAALSIDRRGWRWEAVCLSILALASILLPALLELAAANQDHGLSRRAMLDNYLEILVYAAVVAAVLRVLAFRVPLSRVLCALVPVTFLFFSYGNVNSLLHADALVRTADQSSWL